MADPLPLTDAEWRARLSPEQYRILRRAGTERAFTGRYHRNRQAGTYRCAGCGQVLFASAAKYDSGSGWPAFTQPAAGDAVALRPDDRHAVPATEVLCRRCDGHLGHVIDDGPAPAGLRYCINSAALDFVPQHQGPDLQTAMAMTERILAQGEEQGGSDGDPS